MTKYHAKRTPLNGFIFDSIAEAHRYSELKLAVDNGVISELKIHPRYPIEVNGVKVCAYIADFYYLDRDGSPVVEDVKSNWTRTLPVYRLKRKLMKAVHGIEILEVLR